MDRRIAAPKGANFDKLLDRLTSPIPGTSNEKLFETKQKALMFAAGLGYKKGIRLPLSSRDTSGAIRFDIFENAHDEVFIHALAIVDAGGDLHVLSEERAEEVVTAFEEYAHAGLLELERVCFGGNKDPLDALVDLIIASRQPPRGSESFPGMDPDVLRNLLDA
jgi:dnd system-associated protein 4